MSTSPLADALSNLLFACLPLRNVLKGDARTAFMAAWRAGTDALCNGVFKPDEEAVKAPREAAIELFRHTLFRQACNKLYSNFMAIDVSFSLTCSGIKYHGPAIQSVCLSLPSSNCFIIRSKSLSNRRS